ncbi:ferritin-like domain-containing protein [Granulicella tundricola]|uniref:ferritin-like domain-containing protein n=1 Tax=Granulicella tundricola TaxID=940615 RepID=UPI0002E6E8F9|nr:ferritin-like domain-containing protein [Granulicella tundricola]
MSKLEEISKRALSRRSFLAGTATAAAALTIGCNDATPVTTTPVTPTAPTAPTYTDVDILNFALNLEYLEAEFYLHAATGSGIPAADAGSGAGTVTGGAQITGLTAQQQQYVNSIAQDEYNHVKFLRSALGSAAVSRPAIDLTNSFNALAKAATVGLATPLTTFNPFANFNSFLIGGFIFEDVGVTAYHGAAGAISKTYLAPAASILAVEAYHAAILRTLIVGTSLPTTAAPQGDQTYVNIANAIATFRAAVSGGTSVSAGSETLLSSGLTFSSSTATTPTVGASSIVAADANAVAYARTFDQVLHIVYGTAATTTGTAYGVASGAFFPSGLNGNIKQTYS